MLAEALIRLAILLIEGRKITIYDDGDIRFSKPGKKLPISLVVNSGEVKSNKRKYKEIYLKRK